MTKKLWNTRKRYLFPYFTLLSLKSKPRDDRSEKKIPTKIFEFLDQCFAHPQFWKSLSNSQNLLDGSTRVFLETLFQHRSCAKHWSKHFSTLDFHLNNIFPTECWCIIRIAYLVLHGYGSYTVYPIAKLSSKYQTVSNQNSATISAQNHTFCQFESICFATIFYLFILLVFM